MKPQADQSRQPRLCVLKFGSSVLERPDDYRRAAHEIYRHTRAGEKVIAVVSALDGETDALFDVGTDVGQGSSDALLARLVRCGELKSAALMGLALERCGIPSQVLDPHEMGLRAAGDPLDANLSGLERDRVLGHLDRAEVIVAPGFFGDGEHGPVTLGRGGTDLTAVMFAAWLGASRVRLIKDVDGVYSDDPAKVANAERLDMLDYEEAVRVSHGLVQEKAILAARDSDVAIEVAALGRSYATRIGTFPRRPGSARPPRRLRVAVLGHGAVGAGVCEHLRAHPGRFELAPVLVRDVNRHRAEHPQLDFTNDPAEALSARADIVVETMGGTGFARSLTQSVLRDGTHLVSANKAVIAADLELLRQLAADHDAELRYSAAVGGGVPVLENIDKAVKTGGVLAVEGVMNGTCNFVLGQLEGGALLADAVAEAQARGFAEADPSADLDGSDAADKLAIIIRHAFGVPVSPRNIERESLEDLSAERLDAARETGRRIKQVGRCEVTPDGRVRASVKLLALDRNTALARLENEDNGFCLRLPHEELMLTGKGAGRWPTAESVFADIMDVQRRLAAVPLAATSTGQAVQGLKVHAGEPAR